MTSLPSYASLRIAQLSAVFNRTTNSYKFYWFWGLLELAQEEDQGGIPLEAVLIKMVALSWHTVAYYKVSLGVQDQLSQVIQQALALGELQEQSKTEEIEAYLWRCHRAAQVSEQERHLLRSLHRLSTYVPYRFLSPFFGRLPKRQTEQAIAEQAQASFAVAEEAAPYKINAPSSHQGGRSLIFHPLWRSYLQQHHKILQEFCWWNLCQYLRARNPNVPSISAKLHPPYTVQRRLSTARRFWSLVLEAPDSALLYDIYGGTPLQLSMPIDHFIPWSFVLHDQLWNLGPTTVALNSSKGNRLPSQRYWQPFAELQYAAFQRGYARAKRPVLLLEDYSHLFQATVQAVAAYPKAHFVQQLQRQLTPLWQQAINLGFEADWVAPE